MSESAPIAIIGAGPAGLMAAEILSAAGKRVIVYERMPSVGRKFLMAGRGGLNLTHSEPLEQFLTRYGAARERLKPMIDAFTPADLIAWCESLGQYTFIGSSGRVFPRTMKASPLLRAWLARLSAQGVEIVTRATWRGWNDAGELEFEGAPSTAPNATLLALGGASWPKLGSDGAWQTLLASRGVTLTSLRPANVGFDVAWSEHFCGRFSGSPLKNVTLRFNDHHTQSEVMMSRTGVEGGGVYALSAPIRDAIERGGPCQLYIDLRPDLATAEICSKLARAKVGDTLASTLRKTLGLSPLAISLMHENGPPPRDPHALAAFIKAIPLKLIAAQSLDRAISTAGGVSWDAVDDALQLKVMPDIFVAGEMLDWEAPTGGYLLQACFASGAWAARAILRQASALAAPPSPC